MKRNWERLDSLVWRKEGRGEIWFKSVKSFMAIITWIKTNGLAQPMYLLKIKDKPEWPVILWIWSYLLCTPKYGETFLVQELSIYGMIFHMKSKVLETWTFSKTSSIIGWISERPMKSEKRCFKLSHPWYINIITSIKPIKFKYPHFKVIIHYQIKSWKGSSSSTNTI